MSGGATSIRRPKNRPPQRHDWRPLEQPVFRPAVLIVFFLLASISLAAHQGAWLDVLRSLHDRDAGTRLKAVETLALGGYAQAAEPLAPLIGDPDRRVRFAAIDAELSFCLAEPMERVPASDLASSSRSRAQEAFEAGPLARGAAAGPPAVLDALGRALSDDNARIRFDALHALGVIAEPPLPAAVGQLMADGLDSSDPVFRAATARVLGRLRVGGAGDKLIVALNDRDTREQRYATEALGRIREARAVTSLLERFEYFRQGDMAEVTMQALARIAHPSTHDLFAAHVTEGDAMIRAAAVEGLGRLGDRTMLPMIQDHRQRDEPPVRVAAAFAAGLLGDPQISVIVSAFTNRETSGQALDYLLELRSAAVPTVAAATRDARDAGTRARLVHLLGFLGDKGTVPLVEPFLRDRDDRVARAAIDAVARLSR